MSEESINFSWKEFRSNLLHNQQDLLQEKHFADVTLVSDDQVQIRAHKVLLSASSPVLRRMLLSIPHPHPLVYLRGIPHYLLQSLLQYIYLGETTVAMDTVEEFIAIGKELQIKNICDDPKVESFQLNTEKVKSYEKKQVGKHDSQKDIEVNIANFDIVEFNEEDKDSEEYQNKKQESGGMYFCNLCEFETEYKNSLQTHTESLHEGVRYECNQCDYAATKQGNLKRHTQVKHEDFKFYCEQCDYKTKQQAYLTIHTQSRHEGVTYSCELCDYTVSRQDTLKMHMKTKHEGVMYSCNECDYKTGSSKSIRKHREMNHRSE